MLDLIVCQCSVQWLRCIDASVCLCAVTRRCGAPKFPVPGPAVGTLAVQARLPLAPIAGTTTAPAVRRGWNPPCGSKAGRRWQSASPGLGSRPSFTRRGCRDIRRACSAQGAAASCSHGNGAQKVFCSAHSTGNNGTVFLARARRCCYKANNKWRADGRGGGNGE